MSIDPLSTAAMSSAKVTELPSMARPVVSFEVVYGFCLIRGFASASE